MINYKKSIACLLLFTVFFFSCSNVGVLTRRYRALNEDQPLKQDALKDDVRVFAFVQPEEVPDPKKFVPKTIFDLSPQGQTEIIKRLAGFNGTTADMLLANLKKPLSEPENSKPVKFVDLTKFTKIITITVKKLSMSDADRISSIDVGLTLNNPSIRFTGCDKIVTSYATADLGKLSLSQNFNGELNANLGGGFTGTTSNQNANAFNNGRTNGTTSGNNIINGNPIDIYSNSNSSSNGTNNSNTYGSTNTNTNGTTGQTSLNYGVSGKLSASRSFSEEVSLKQRFVNLSAYFDDNRGLHFYQEGISGIDVSGNIIPTVKLEFINNITESTSYNFNDLFTDGVANGINTIKGNQITYSFPAISNDIEFTISYDGVFREVEKNKRTISEADDKITRKHGNVKLATAVGIIKKEEFTPKRWYLTTVNELGVSANVLEVISPSNTAGAASGPLFFDTYENAIEFQQWLQVSFAALTANNLKFGLPNKQYQLRMANKNPIVAATVSGLTLKIFGR